MPAHGPARTFLEIVGEAGTSRPGAAGPAARPGVVLAPAEARAPPASETAPVRALLEQAARADRDMETVLEAARRGRTFSPAELLQLQVTVFRCTQTVEIVSRGVDRLIGGVKQALGTQV